MDIIIFSGQSNMQGESEKLTSTSIIENAYEYRYLTDTAKPLCNPVGEDITYKGTAGCRYTESTETVAWLNTHVLGSACFGHTNLVPSFCNTYCRMTGHRVLAVHAARGSSAIEKWMPGMPQYQMLIQKSKAAIRYAQEQDSIEHIFFVWFQGESDAKLGHSKEYYKKSILTLKDALMDELGIHCFGIIRVGHFCRDERDIPIIETQDEVCRDYDGFLMLTTITADLETSEDGMNPLIEGHFSAIGLECIGAAAGKTLATINRKEIL